MSARANPYHNAWFEFFMDTLKTEMLQRGCFIDEHDARAGIFDFIEAYYKHLTALTLLLPLLSRPIRGHLHSLN